MKIIFNIFILSIILVQMAVSENLPSPPKAAKIIQEIKIHGKTLTDNYYWLRDKTNPEVINYLKNENDYAAKVMSGTKEIQEKFYNEMVSRIQETDLSVPVKEDDYFYYSRSEKGKQYSIHCRKKGNLAAQEEILIDENILAESKVYFDLGNYDISPDHNLIAYSIDTTGYETFTIYFKDLRTGKLLADEIKKSSSGFEWANDNKTFYYTTLNDVQQADKVWKHVLGQSQPDELIYQEKDNAYFLSLYKTKDKSTILISLGSKDESELWLIDANKPEQKPSLLKKRSKNFEYYLESHGDSYFIWTNDKAINFKIMTVLKSNPAYQNWKEFLPYNENIKINSIEPFKNYLVIHERAGGFTKMKIYHFSDKSVQYIDFPEKVYSYYSNSNPDFNSDKIRITYTSLITPSTVFDIDMISKKFELLKETPVLGGYDKTKYESLQIFATAKDGTKIPISLVYKKGLKKTGNNPALLYAYGSYGFSMDTYFSSNRLSLLDRGFIYAIAHIRGGGELGEMWYKNGKMLKKKNTFTDFISCAEKLIKNKYTDKDHLVIEGGSAGGLLMGAVNNIRPDLFKVVIAEVPFVDVINTMMDPTIPLTVAEYNEWGNPSTKKYFDYMLSYSPYNNVTAKNYPNILVRAGLSDPRVAFWEPAKWTAKLRDLKIDNNTLILVTNMDAGHGGASGRYSRLKDIAYDYAFMFKMLGIKE
jgi:oligopeptidase B